MSVIQKIRDKYAALAIAVIAIAMVGFILIDALSNRTGGGMFSKNSTVVGNINGEKIEYAEFDNMLKRAEENYQSRGMQMNELQRGQLNNKLWETIVVQKVVSEQVEKLGLAFTGKEMDDLLYGPNAPEELKEQYADPKTGQYDPALFSQARKELLRRPVNDPKRLALEDFIDNQVVKGALRNKYLIMLMGASYYPKWVAEKDNQDNSSVANITYAAFPYSLVQDGSVAVSDAEVSDYLQAHKTQYETKEGSRNISFVSFNADASAKDSAAVLSQIQGLKSGFAAAKDVAGFMNQNGTTLPFFDGYVAKKSIMIPAKDSILSLPINGVYGPYVDKLPGGTTGNYVIAKMLDKRDLPDSVKCRYILISTRNGTVPDSVAKERADSISLALQKGADFKTLDVQLSDDEASKEKGGENTFLYTQAYSMTSQAGLPKSFADFLFLGNKGEKKVVKFDGGYLYAEILDQEGIEPYVKVAYLSKEIFPSDETVNAANAAATQFAAQSQSEDAFMETAHKQNILIRSATVKESDFEVQGVGAARRLVSWSFSNKVGTVGDPESYGDQYVVALVSGAQDAGLPTGSFARTLVENSVRKEKKAKQIEGTMGVVTDIAAAAAKFNVTVQRADSVSFSSPFIPNVGNEPAVVGSAFGKANLNKVSAPFKGNTGVYVLRTESVTSIPNQNNDYSVLRQEKEGQMRNYTGSMAEKGLMDAAEVKDNRIKFY